MTTYVGPYQRARKIVAENSSRLGAVHIENALVEAIAAEIGAAELLAIPHRSDPQTILANAFALSSAEQFRLAFQIAENIGCTISRGSHTV